LTTVVDAFDIKRTVQVRFLSALLWLLRMASRPRVVFAVLFLLYALFGFLVFGGAEGAWMAGSGCTLAAWLLVRCCRETAGRK
jgi:hypothetical protein